MIDYVVEGNIDDRILTRASHVLQNGGLLCFPTESSWVVTCDPYNKSAVDKLYHLRHIENTKHLTVLCSNFQMAMEIAHIDNGAFSLIKRVIPGPYTFIFEAQKKITKYLKASKYDHQVGLRFPPRELCRAVLEHYGDVVICTHISQDMMKLEEDELIYSALIEDYYGTMIDLILDPGEIEFSGQTTIIDFTSGIPEIVREGAGDTRFFARN